MKNGKICLSFRRIIHPDKIDIENLIYALAAYHKSRLYHRGACLCVDEGPDILCRLVRLYNLLFQTENEQFLAQDLQHTQRQLTQFYADFQRDCKEMPLAPSFVLQHKKTLH